MEIEKIARKLAPLEPEGVKHWFRERDFARAGQREWLDKDLLEHAHQILGDFRNKLLLSLPSQAKSRGEFNLGTVLYEEEKWPVGISRGELLQNFAIFGRSGAGKTNVVFHLLQQLIAKKVPFLFLDWKRTARHLLPAIRAKVNVFTPGRALSPFVFNPFVAPPNLERHVYIGHVIDVMSQAYQLGEGSRRILQKALSACYQAGNSAPTAEQVLAEVGKLPDKGRAGQWKVSALRALESMAFSQLTSTEQVSQREIVDTLLKGNTIIELDSLDESSKQFLIPLLCLWLYSVKLTSKEREKLGLVVFIEEAHHVLYRQENRSTESVMNRLLRQCREIGIGIVVVDQHPHLISAAVLGNCYTSVCLNQKDPSDITKAARLSLIPDDEKHHLSMLPVGQGVVKLQDRWRRPFVVKFPLVDIKKGLVTDAMLTAILNGTMKPADLRRVVREERQGEQKPGTGERYLTEDEYRFLHDVLQNPDSGVEARYKRLGFSVERGQRLKETLLDRGWLADNVVRIGNTRRTLLRIPRREEDLLGIELKNVPANTVVHEYWKGHYAGVYQEKGYHVEVEFPRRGGRVDVLAVKKGERIGIEIETGKSDVVANVKHGLLSRFDKVLVVATSEAAMRKVENQLARAGLLIPGKLDLILRDASAQAA